MNTLESTSAQMKQHGAEAFNHLAQGLDAGATFLLHLAAVALMASAQGLLNLNAWMHRPQFGVSKEKA